MTQSSLSIRRHRGERAADERGVGAQHIFHHLSAPVRRKRRERGHIRHFLHAAQRAVRPGIRGGGLRPERFAGLFDQAHGRVHAAHHTHRRAGGALRGWLYFAFRKARPARVRAAIIALSALLLLAGLHALYCFRADGLANLFTGEETADPAQMHALSRVLAERAAGTKDPAGNLATYRTLITGGLFLCAALGLCLLMADAIAQQARGGRASANWYACAHARSAALPA